MKHNDRPRNFKPDSTPAVDIPEFDLDALVAQITAENRHDELGTGPASGNEFG